MKGQAKDAAFAAEDVADVQAFVAALGRVAAAARAELEKYRVG